MQQESQSGWWMGRSGKGGYHTQEELVERQEKEVMGKLDNLFQNRFDEGKG